MGVSVYLNFKGDCREAVNFYAKVFGLEAPKIMTYGEGPSNPEYPMDEATKRLVMHAELKVAGSTLMFSDTPGFMEFVKGNNITLYVPSRDADELRRWFDAMKEGGKVDVELGPTFWAKLYGYVRDKFGIGWQFGMEE